MFVDLNELKGLLIDLDTFEEWYDINWTTLDPKVTCLFFSMNEDKLQRIKEMDDRFLTFTGKLFMNSFVSPIHDESLRKVLYKLNLLQVNVALVSMNYDNLISIRSALIGTIFVEPSPSNIPYKILGKLTDFKIHNIEQINEIILRRFTGYIAEVSSIRFNDGDKLISDRPIFG